MQTRRSNSVSGILNGLVACEAITDREAQAYRERLSTRDRSNAWDDLVERFGVHEDPKTGRYCYNIPTMRGELTDINNAA